MKNQKIRTGKLKMKAMFLAGVIVFESVFAGIGPVKAQTISENGIAAEETSERKNLQVQEEEVSPENATIKYSGTDGAINWSLDENGHLTITGNGDYDGDPEWCGYSEEIKSAEVSVTNITRTRGMFVNCSNMMKINLSNFNTSQVTDMSYMFWGCSSLTSLDLSSFDTGNVKDMSYMFLDCSAVSYLDLSTLDTSNVTNMDSLFDGCQKLTAVVLNGKFTTKNVKGMSYMFYNCENLASIDLSNFNTANVETVSHMFYNCKSLTSLDLTGFNTANVKYMSNMFYNCDKLVILDLSTWSLDKLQKPKGMLKEMDGLIKITLPNTPVEIELPGAYYNDNKVLTQIAGANRGKVTYTSPVYADSYCGTNGHTYLTTFTWAEDYSSATVYMECIREDCAYDIDDKYVQMDAVVTKEVINPTTEKEGATVYTAMAVHKGKTYTDVKSVLIPKLPQQPAQPQNPEQSQQPTAKPVGTSFNTSTTFYRVTKAGKTPEIAYMGPKNKKVKKVTIPATVTIDGVTYKVTSVATGALKKYKNLTTVTVGKNVTKIGKNAFYGCKKLKKIVIKGKKLKSVGKNAFKGIKKNATIDVPNSKKKAYKKLFKAKTGYKKKTMKIK